MNEEYLQGLYNYLKIEDTFDNWRDSIVDNEEYLKGLHGYLKIEDTFDNWNNEVFGSATASAVEVEEPEVIAEETVSVTAETPSVEDPELVSKDISLDKQPELEVEKVVETVGLSNVDIEAIKEQKALDFKNGRFLMAEIEAKEKFDLTGEVDVELLSKESLNPEKSLLGDYGSQFINTILSLSKGVEEFKTGSKMLATKYAMDIFDSEATEEEKQAVLDKIKSTGEVRTLGLTKGMEALNENLRVYETESMVDDFNNGDYGQFTERVVGQAIGAIPSILLTSTGIGGIITLGTSSAGSKFNELIEENPEESLERISFNALGTGAVEAAFEFGTRGILKRAGVLGNSGSAQAAKDLINSYTSKFAKYLDIPLEGGLEAGTVFFQDLLDALPRSLGGLGKAEQYESMGDYFEARGTTRKMWEAFNVGTVMGGGVNIIGGLKSNNQNKKDRAVQVLMPQSDKKIINDAAVNINSLNSQIKEVNEKADVEKLEAQIVKEQEVISSVKNKVSEELNMMNPDELKSYAANQDEIIKERKRSISKSPFVRKVNAQNLVNLELENQSLIRESVNRRLSEVTETVNVKDIGRTVNSYNDTQSFQKAFNNTKDGKNSSMNVEGADGFIDSNGDIFINRIVAEKVKNVNVPAHELFHGIIKNNIQEPGQLNKLVDEFKSVLPKDQLEKVQKRIDDNYRYERDEEGNITKELKKEEYNEEYFTAFADLIGNRQIEFNENIFTNIGEFLTPIFTKKGYGNIKFKTGKDVYNFIKTYQKEISKGELSKETIKAAKKVTEEDIKTKFSKTEENKEIKEIFDEFTGPAENRKFKSKEEFKGIPKINEKGEIVYDEKGEIVYSKKPAKEFFAALKEIEQSETLDASIRNIVGKSYLDINPGFVKEVKEKISDKFKSEYDASKNSLFGWLTGKNISGQPLINRAAGDIQIKRGKKPSTVSADKKIGDEESRVTIGETLVSDEISPEDYTDMMLAQDKLKKIKPQQSKIAKKIDLTKNELNLVKRDVTNFLRKSDRPAMTDPKKFFKSFVDYMSTATGNRLYDKLSAPKDGLLSTKNRKAFIESIAEDLIALNKVDPSVMRRSNWTPFYELEIKRMNPTQTQKAIDEGRVPSTTNLNAGNDLFITLDPSTEEVVDYLMGIRPDVLKRKMPKFLAEVIAKNEFNDIVNNPNQPVYDTKGDLTDRTIDLSENITEEEIVRGAPQVIEKIARPKGIKFSKSKVKNELDEINKSKSKDKKSGKEELDLIVDSKGLANIRGDINTLKSVMLMVADKSKRFGLDGINKILMPGNLTSGNRIDLLRRFGFNVISNPEKIKNKKLKKEAYEAIEKGEFLDLSSVLKEVTKGVKKIKNENVDAIKIALGAKSGEAARRNASRKKQHDKGVKLITKLELDIFLESAEGEAFIRLISHNDKLNKNGSRNQALPNSVEEGATINGKRRSETTDEHQWQANEWVKGKLKLFKNIKNNLGTKQEEVTRKALDLYLKFSKDNYTQFLLKNETDIIKGDLTNEKGETWVRSDRKLHPLLKEKINNFIELASKKGTTVEQLQKAYNEIPSADIRYFSDFAYVNPNFIRTYKADGNYVTKAEEYNVVVPGKFKNDPNVIIEQGKIIESVILSEAGVLTGAKSVSRAQAKQLINESLEIAPGQQKAGKFSKSVLSESKVLNLEGDLSMQELLGKAASIDQALNIARDINAPVKKIRVFDFDDTLATTKSNVLFTAPDGTEGSLTAEKFAMDGARLLEEGYLFDFTEFDKVTKGKPGPLLDLAKKIQDARGTEDVFVLTARAPQAAIAIKEFLDSQGLNIPLKNITGLGRSTGEAKANWMIDKAAEGYNDFYFADDALQNVKAVKDVMSVVDVKSKVQQAKFSKSKDLSSDFNKLIEESTAIGAEKVFSDVKAQVRGAKAKRQRFFIPPSAEDMLGLVYRTLGKGKKGEAHLKFYQENLFDPYTRAMENLSTDRVNLMSDFKALKKQLDVPKDLTKKTESGFTKEQATRVYLWNKMGEKIPGLSKADLKELNDVIENDAKLKVFADQILSITKGDGYSTPKENWAVGTITTDLIDVLNTKKRSKYLETWRQNKDLIYSKENLNKLEAAYGPKYRAALENSLRRMESGSNRISGGNRLSNQVLDYINNSTGAIMFFNARSAVLQTISAANFINWGFNNPYKAGKAFANQPQYWKDFTELMNSDYLKDRRNGLKLNINESEIANAAKTSGNKAKAALNYILEKGYLPTKFADSFAIASGGATFYRNRINDLIKNEGKTEAEAKEIAMKEFRQVSEMSQQSSDPSKISQQQSSDLGRVVLQFANTPMQYARIQKRAVQDIANGRGDLKTNISKIAYYGFLQNMLFNGLQQAVTSLGFGDEEMTDAEEKKLIKAANGMLDSSLRGLGMAGVTVQVLKNLGIDIYDRSKRDRPEFTDSYKKLLEFSPAIKSKLGKFQSAAYPFDSKKRRAEVFEKGFSLDNPAYESMAKVITGTTNLPLDRLYSKVNNLSAAMDEENEAWQSIAMVLGWPEWQIKGKQNYVESPEAKKKNSSFGGSSFSGSSF